MKRKTKINKLKVASVIASFVIAGAILVRMNIATEEIKENTLASLNEMANSVTQIDFNQEDNVLFEDDIIGDDVPQLPEEQVVEIPKETQTEAQTKEAEAKNVTTDKATSAFHFEERDQLSWPVKGNVLIPYSDEVTVHYATLDEYKTSDAMVIAAEVGSPVKAAASGIVTDIYSNEETGLTMSVDIGDGYSVIYGQLDSVVCSKGSTIRTGETIGNVGKPTAYYTKEGANLYFSLRKDDCSLDPIEYLSEN